MATAFELAANILLGQHDDPLAGLSWEAWNRLVAPQYFTAPYSDHHRTFWEWTETITAAERPPPFLAFWPRGHAKSSNAEVALVKLGARRLRNYALYVSATQDQADDHVQNIGSVLESDGIAEYYPAMADRMVNKFGSAKGWRRNRLRTASGFTVDALGLDSARRGAKLDAQRPDVIVFDDIDDTHDSPRVVERKRRTISQALLPAVTRNAVAIMAQNLTHPGSLAALLTRGEIDLFAGAVLCGPFPAVRDMQLANEDGLWRVVGGEATWAGMPLEACEQAIQLYGLTSFVIESQQDISERPGALWTRDLIDEHRMPAPPPEMDRIVVAIDPNQTGGNDDAGIVVIGRGKVGKVQHAFVLADHTQTSAPEVWRDVAADVLRRWGAGCFVVEATGLGNHARLTLQDAPELRGQPVRVEEVQAKLSKRDRARPIAQLYADGRVHHCGAFPVLETQLTTWEPETSSISPGGLDAMVHGVTHLLIDRRGGPKIRYM